MQPLPPLVPLMLLSLLETSHTALVAVCCLVGAAVGAAAVTVHANKHHSLKQHNNTDRFLRGPQDDDAAAVGSAAANSWGARLARRYYARLFKEYAIADLSRLVTD